MTARKAPPSSGYGGKKAASKSAAAEKKPVPQGRGSKQLAAKGQAERITDGVVAPVSGNTYGRPTRGSESKPASKAYGKDARIRDSTVAPLAAQGQRIAGRNQAKRTSGGRKK